MDPHRREPILGNNFPGDRTCTRMVVGGKCDRPGVWHIVWTDLRASVACEICGRDVRDKYVFDEIHPLGDACVSPSGMFIPDVGCIFPSSEEDYEVGKYLIGY